ncbi:hypothetical protein A1O1_02014 [Capronia coronata CBS 617.96]|uniref:Luciferase domain-containing protein n=1 Tax=Capronia coronata CBS 617.96 TaxID=1182541 RepID=W9YL27_9EURO|nr:uncharacterized protein A1O1_02014 [Capronia coronata CBS 617.96]EXJ93622.1 hypothetical protein A1O1_02014 [Capronia coronata CBS 617.96]
METITAIATSLSTSITALFQRINTNRFSYLIYPAALAGAVGSFFLARAARADYKTYLSYGPGGPPYNVLGWFVTSTVVRAMTIDGFDLRKCDKDLDRRTWLGPDWEKGAEKHVRTGGRPKIGPHPAPQRQLDQLPGREVQEKLLASFTSIVAHNPTLVQFKPSIYERRHEAIFIADTCPVTTKDVLGYPLPAEISHIHATTDYSVHVVLSPRDAATVIRAGWGQLHGLAGLSVAGITVLPKSYVLLYAPRNEDEVHVVMEIVRASIGYMTQTEMEGVKPA